MKKTLLCLLGIVTLSLAGGLLAQTDPVEPTGPPGDESASFVTGTVVSSSGSSLVVRLASGEELALDVDSSTLVPPGLAAGTEVDLKYHAMSGGRLHAAEVRLVKSADTSAAAASTPADSTGGGTEALPQTASSLPLVALLGTLSLGAGCVAWLLSRRPV